MIIKVILVLIVAIYISTCLGDTDEVGGVRCPLVENTERYPIANLNQCDKFHYCVKGFVKGTFLCSDGLVFDGKTCSLPQGVDCKGRRQLQEPSGTPPCVRRYGNFPVEGSCTEYYSCIDNNPTRVTCASFLVFDPESGVCKRPDEKTRPECSAKTQYSYECPSDIRTQKLFASRDDCRAFFTCGPPSFVPILGGCPYGSVFNEARQRCDDPKRVPQCERYYESLTLPEFDNGKYREETA